MGEYLTCRKSALLISTTSKKRVKEYEDLFKKRAIDADRRKGGSSL